MSGTSLEPVNLSVHFDVPDLATSGEEAYVYFHLGTEAYELYQSHH